MEGNEDILQSIEQCFYVDNCLQSLSSPGSAKLLINKLREFLATGGLEIRQWPSNDPLSPIYRLQHAQRVQSNG